jgi:hypothetical protein
MSMTHSCESWGVRSNAPWEVEAPFAAGVI